MNEKGEHTIKPLISGLRFKEKKSGGTTALLVQKFRLRHADYWPVLIRTYVALHAMTPLSLEKKRLNLNGNALLSPT